MSFFPLSPHSPSCKSLSATVPMLLSNKGGVPRAWVPPECQPFPSLALRGLICLHSWPRDHAKGKWLGGGPAFSVVCWEMGNLHKSFQTKAINIICGAIRLSGYNMALTWPLALSPGSVQRHDGAPLDVSPSPMPARWNVSLPPSPARSLFRLSFSRLDNGWTPTGSGGAQRRGVNKG